MGKKRKEVVVVGGGLAGLAAAMKLAEMQEKRMNIAKKGPESQESSD